LAGERLLTLVAHLLAAVHFHIHILHLAVVHRFALVALAADLVDLLLNFIGADPGYRLAHSILIAGFVSC
jgi:hypothetical protein